MGVKIPIRNPYSYLPRRLQIAVSLITFVFLVVTFFGSSTVQKPLRSQSSLFLQSKTGEVSWIGHRNWQHPFSSTESNKDEILLPVEESRVSIYTYYDNDVDEEKDVDRALLLTWRRAWWAKGFKPIILGPGDAQKHDSFKKVQGLGLEKSMERDLFRWLAWSSSGSGIFTDSLLIPMCEYDHSFMKTLRQGMFGTISKSRGLEEGIISAGVQEVNQAINALLVTDLSTQKTVLGALSSKLVQSINPKHSMAFYSTSVIKDKYKVVYEQMVDESIEKRIEGKHELRQLIESHLHSTWQQEFPKGIAVINPLPEAMTSLLAPAAYLAGNLTMCLDTPLPSSCPPNMDECNTCTTSKPMIMSLNQAYDDKQKVFTLGTVTHPYTLLSLTKHALVQDLRWVVTNTTRDAYIIAATSGILGKVISSWDRLSFMKDAIASDKGKMQSLWFTVEQDFDVAWYENMSWFFGFPIVKSLQNPNGSGVDMIGLSDLTNKQTIAQDLKLVKKSTAVIKMKKSSISTKVNPAVEAWNMADSELWHFTRALQLRERDERWKWEEEDKGFGSVVKKTTSMWNLFG